MKPIDPQPARPSHATSRVMIVDSDERFALLLESYLERLGHHIFRVADPRYALRMLRELSADLVITSLDGDETDGVELLVGLAAEPRRTPVLLCTRNAGSGAAVVSATRALGVSQVLPRPCRFDVISAAVQTLLGKPALRDVAGNDNVAASAPAGAAAVAGRAS